MAIVENTPGTERRIGAGNGFFLKYDQWYHKITTEKIRLALLFLNRKTETRHTPCAGVIISNYFIFRLLLTRLVLWSDYRPEKKNSACVHQDKE
jgi:hypothetical protein